MREWERGGVYGDEIRGIKAAMHALHPIIIPHPGSASGWALNRVSHYYARRGLVIVL